MVGYVSGAVSEQRVTWKYMQSLFPCLCLAKHILKIQLCIPINHRVDTN